MLKRFMKLPWPVMHTISFPIAVVLIIASRINNPIGELFAAVGWLFFLATVVSGLASFFTYWRTAGDNNIAWSQRAWPWIIGQLIFTSWPVTLLWVVMRWSSTGRVFEN